MSAFSLCPSMPRFASSALTMALLLTVAAGCAGPRYVVGGGDHTVLIEQSTGKTWVLQKVMTRETKTDTGHVKEYHLRWRPLPAPTEHPIEQPMTSTATGDPRPGIALPLHQWQPRATQQSVAKIADNAITLNATKPGGALMTMPRPYELSSDYAVEFEFKVHHDDNHWMTLYSDGYVQLVIDWGTEVKHYQPGRPYKVSLPLINLEVGRWHTFRLEAHPQQGTVNIFADGSRIGAATSLRAPLDRHTPNARPDWLFVGEAEDITTGRAEAWGAGSWRNFRITRPKKTHTDSDA